MVTPASYQFSLQLNHSVAKCGSWQKQNECETGKISLNLCRWQYRSIFIQIFTVSSERRPCFETECIMTLQGHKRSLIMVYDFLFDLNSNLSCRVSEILELLYAESHFFSTPPLFGRKFRGVPLRVDPRYLGFKEGTSQANWWWNYFGRIPIYVIAIHQRYRETDRQTDRRPAIAIPRFALKCIAR